MTDTTNLPIGQSMLPYGDGAIARALAERDGGVLLQGEDGWRECAHGWVEDHAGARKPAWVPCDSSEPEQSDMEAVEDGPEFARYMAKRYCAPLPGCSPWLPGPPPDEVPEGWVAVIYVRGQHTFDCVSYDWAAVLDISEYQSITADSVHWTLLPAPPAREVKTDD